MKAITLTLLLWPIHAFGFIEFPTAPPPFGFWKCNIQDAIECSWDDHLKSTKCSVQSVGESACFDFRAKQYTISSPCETEKETLIDIGPTAEMWSVIYKVFGVAPVLYEIDPHKGRIIGMMYGDDTYIFVNGTCEEITPEEPDQIKDLKSNEGTTIIPPAND